MKRLWVLLLALVLIIAGCTSQNEQAPTTSEGESTGETTVLKDGTYPSTQTGHNGPIDYEVVIADGKISEIKLGRHFETVGVSTKAIETDLPERIIEKQSIAVDNITGATISSLATKNAVKDAIEQAGGNVEDFSVKEDKPAPEEIEDTADIIVVGGGGAGLSATVTAINEGASVIIVEKSGYLGGTTMVAGSLYNSPDEELQSKEEMQAGHLEIWEDLLAKEPISEEHKELQDVVRAQFEEWKASGSTHLLDSKEFYALQTWDGGDYIAKLDLVKELANNSYDSMKWLEGLGWEYEDFITTGAGALYPRSHKGVKPLGMGFIDAYMTHIESSDAVKVYLDTEATELVKDDTGRVVSVKGKDKDGNTYTFTAKKGILLSTGGFGGNAEMVQSYNTEGKWPDLSNRKSSNLPAIKGDGIQMAKAIDAKLVDMEQLQLLFTTEPTTGQAGIGNFKPNGTAGFIFVNQEGERFVREDGRRDEISLAMLNQTDQLGYMIQSASSGNVDLNTTTDLNGVPLPDLIDQGYVFYGKTLEEAAEQANIPYDTLLSTIESYNENVENKVDEDEFGRKLFIHKLEGEDWYIVPRSPAVHHTMGGVAIDTKTHVIGNDNEVIPGLYAAGEVVGGIHGGNRLGGNAIVDTVVFGRLAAQNILQDSSN